MKRLLTIIVFMLPAVVAVNAQGSVTVSQSAEIDALVNGKKASKKNNKELIDSIIFTLILIAVFLIFVVSTIKDLPFVYNQF